MSKEIFVNLEFTPNPNTLKFSVNVALLDQGAANFETKQATKDSPLAALLFEITGVQALMIGTNFVTVTKAPEGSWDTLASEIPKALEEHLSNEKPVMADGWTFQSASAAPSSDVEKQICQILDSEIRPAVAMDGGDITFAKYENGVVYLHLQGACSSCPSSIQTLKMGVETRLKKSLPEIKEVVQL